MTKELCEISFKSFMKIQDCTLEDLQASASGLKYSKRMRLVNDNEEDECSPQLHQFKDTWNEILADYTGSS